MADGGDGFMGRCEIVEPRRRNRQWPAEVKAKIVAESYQPGARVVDMARKYDLLPHHLSDWRRHARQGRLALPGDLMDALNGSPASESAEPAFVPLSILPEPMDQRNHPPRAVLADRVSGREAWPPVMLFVFTPIDVFAAENVGRRRHWSVNRHAKVTHLGGSVSDGHNPPKWATLSFQINGLGSAHGTVN